MLHSLRAEFRKLCTIRSTYILFALAVSLMAAIALYYATYKSRVVPLTEVLHSSISLGVLFCCFTVALLMAHEYRYNTIVHTLTTNARRGRVLLAKILTAIVFGAAYSITLMTVTAGSYMLFRVLRGTDLPPLGDSFLPVAGMLLLYYIGYALVGLIIATLVRSIVATIGIVFSMSFIVEPLLGLMILRESGKYLPFASLDAMVSSAHSFSLTSGNALAMSGVYIGIGLFISWALFRLRDAN
jgi:ABC-2 type transport system permease protein